MKRNFTSYVFDMLFQGEKKRVGGRGGVIRTGDGERGGGVSERMR